MPEVASVREPKIYDIVKYGNPILEKAGAAVTKFDEALKNLTDDMFATMYAAQGVGLAAPQVGVSKRVAVVDVSSGKSPDARIVLANPQVTHAEGEQREEEGCLSLPTIRGVVTRPLYVTVRAQNVQGEWFEMRGEALLARAFCHEIDHLDGVLFIQHLGMLKRDLIKRRIRKMMKNGEW